MSYGNWFKCSRSLFFESVEEGNPHDMFIFVILAARCRFNGTRRNLEIGQALMGLDEIGKLVRASRKEVSSSLKRLAQKGIIKVLKSDRNGTLVLILDSFFYEQIRDSKVTNNGQIEQTNKEEIRLDKINYSGGIAPLSTIRTVNKKNNKELVGWDSIKGDIFKKAQELHGYSDSFMEERWLELLAWDEGRPYKNRKSGATNWFNSPITKDKWAKRPKTSKEELEELRAFAATGGIIF
jgi:hypothetical protein